MRAYGVGVLVAGLVLGACGMQQARVASDAPTLMVGTTEVWSYPSGDGAVDTMSSSGQGWASGTKPNSQAYCTINIAMAAGRVSKMSYVGPGGEPISSSSQCAYALQSCIK
jgi:hypothetical protein